MKEQNVAKAYATAMYDLAKEKGVDIASELIKLNELINKNNNLENVLFLDVFTPEEKTAVMNDISSKLGLSGLLKNFINFTISEKRLGLFPLIYKEVVVRDDHEKGFLRGTIEGAEDDVDAAFREKITAYLKGKINKDCKLDYVKNSKITAGYRVTVEDLQLDASLDNQLNKFKETVLNS